MTAPDVEPGVTTTISGLRFSFTDPRPEQICIVDIARGLSNAARYSGQTLRYYSVAEHSIIMSQIVMEIVGQRRVSSVAAKLHSLKVARHLGIVAMIHDGPEAYTGDMPAPLKVLLPRFKEIEDLIWRAMAAAFDVAVEIDPLIKTIDLAMRPGERARLKYDDGPPPHRRDPLLLSQLTGAELDQLPATEEEHVIALRTRELLKPLGPDEAFVQFMLRWSQLTAAAP